VRGRVERGGHVVAFARQTNVGIDIVVDVVVVVDVVEWRVFDECARR
jgi:hypothetical protein